MRIILIFLLFSSAKATYPCASDTIPADTNIYPPYARTSCNGCFKLVFQTDGNMVVYQNPTNAVVWSANTFNSGAVRAAMQKDGNFVLYTSSNSPVWSSGSTLR